MRRKVVSLILIFVCFLFQSTFWNIFPFTNIKPNLMLILVVSFALMHGSRSGMWIGFISGFLSDILYGDLFGVNALLFLYIGFFIGKMYQVFFDDDIRVALLAVGISDLVYNIIYYIIKFAFGIRYNFPAYATHIMIPEIIFTLIFTVILYRIFYMINRKLQEDELEEQDSPWLLR